MNRAGVLRLARVFDRAGDPRGALLRSGQPVKTCSCGRGYTLLDLFRHLSAGIQNDENGRPVLELFTCRCGSTFGVPAGLTNRIVPGAVRVITVDFP